MCALNPQRSNAISARSSFSLAIRVQHGARGEDLVCGSQRRYLRAMKTRPSTPGKINAPLRLTSQNISPTPFRPSLRRDQSSRALIGRKAANCRAELSQVRVLAAFLAAKIEFSYGAGQTVNLL